MSYPNGMMGAPALYDSKPQTISADGGEVWLHAPGCAGGVITVEGTFSGTLSLVGAIERGAAEGPRLLFQSGVGSIGRNYVVGYGAAVDREYRFIDGANWLCLRASNWVSGSVTVRIVATHSPAAMFSIGPVRTTFEEAERAGRAYSVGTGTLGVTGSNYLQWRMENPSGSGKRYYITERWFSNDRASGQENLETEFYPTYATPLDGATTRTPNNLLPSGPASDAVFEYVVDNTTLGTAALGQVLPVDGVILKIEVDRVLEPGQSFAYQIGGAGGSLSNAARIASTVIWYEEDLQ